MANILYTEMAAVCAVVLAILLNRTLATYEEGFTRNGFVRLLVFSIVFCTIDAIWGIFASHTLVLDKWGLLVSTYAFHAMSALAAFFWLRFTIGFFEKKVFVIGIKVFGWMLLLAQLIILVSNVFLNQVFVISEVVGDGPIYKTLAWRSALFYLQFANYLTIGIYALIVYASKKKKDYKIKNIIIFSIVSIIMGILQLAFPDMPMYSCGFMISALVIFGFVITKEQQEIIALRNTIEIRKEKDEIAEAVSLIAPIIISLNVSKNEYKILSHDGFSKRKALLQGNIDFLLSEGLPSIYDDDMPKFKEMFDRKNLIRAYNNGDHYVVMEHRQVGSNGAVRWVYTRVVFLEESTNDNILAIWIAQDMEEVKRQQLIYQEQIEKACEEAEEANKAKTNFLSSMSHDIRTPMNAIVGMVDIAKTKVDKPEEVLDSLNKIGYAGRQLVCLVNDILDYSVIESGKLSIRYEDFNVIEGFEHFKYIYQASYAEKKLKCEYIIHDTIYPYISVDPVRINQISGNLVSNAIKYTPEGGRIRVETYQEMRGDKLYSVFIVSDTGIGMSKEFMNDMWGTFTRATDTRINRIVGAGLGLSIVKSLVDMLDGTIEVQSELNKGSTFTVSIPTKPSVSATFIEDDLEDLYENRKYFLLVAEDNDLNYEIIKELLEIEGISCERAENGEECIHMFEESTSNKYDAILMDIQMPVMNGLEATKIIRKSSHMNAKTIPIIAMTANAFNDDIDKCLKAGMNDHLSKPVEMNRVRMSLKKWIKY